VRGCAPLTPPIGQFCRLLQLGVHQGGLRLFDVPTNCPALLACAGLISGVGLGVAGSLTLSISAIAFLIAGARPARVRNSAVSPNTRAGTTGCFGGVPGGGHDYRGFGQVAGVLTDPLLGPVGRGAGDGRDLGTLTTISGPSGAGSPRPWVSDSGLTSVVTSRATSQEEHFDAAEMRPTRCARPGRPYRPSPGGLHLHRQVGQHETAHPGNHRQTSRTACAPWCSGRRVHRVSGWQTEHARAVAVAGLVSGVVAVSARLPARAGAPGR
jgi:hypothetical protein